MASNNTITLGHFKINKSTKGKSQIKGWEIIPGTVRQNKLLALSIKLILDEEPNVFDQGDVNEKNRNGPQVSNADPVDSVQK